MNVSSGTARRLILIAFGLAFISLACFAIPLYVIRPFRHQGAAELRLALFIKQIGPPLSTACALIALAIVALSWSRAKTWLARSFAVLSLALAAAGAWLSRVNVYELMFHPIDAPQFASIAHPHLDADEMVIAVRVNGMSRAYPIREMAYHHVINDTVGGEPIAATY